MILAFFSCDREDGGTDTDSDVEVDARCVSYSVDCDQVRYHLIQAFETDQGVRNGIEIYGTMEDVDRANQELLISILQCCGPEKIVSAGDRPTLTAFLIAQHAPIDFQLRYAPIFKNWASEGILPYRTFVLMIDRMRMHQGEPQLYGTQVISNDEGKMELYKVDDLEKVRLRRDSLNMETLENYLKRLDVILP